MRTRLPLLILAATAALAGCSQSDDQVRDELRSQMLGRCNSEIAPKAAQLPGFDTAAYCACVTEQALGQRSAAELKTMFEDRARVTEQGRQAAAVCLARQTSGDEGGTVGPPGNSKETDPPEPKEKAEPRPAARAPARPRAATPTPQPDPQPADEGGEDDPDE